jgi:hypothetical protein
LNTANVSISDLYIDPITFLASRPFGVYPRVLGPGGNITLVDDIQYIAHLQELLLMHVIGFEGGIIYKVPTLYGWTKLSLPPFMKDVNVTIVEFRHHFASYHQNSTANIVSVDQLSSDGIMHQIKMAYYYHPLSITDLLELTNMVPGFTILRELLEFTGLAALVVGPDLTATVFAPTDIAFKCITRWGPGLLS